mmetsp:Transcript_17463/g.26417  ORF Transcript_17463/g.26417 Transcript_17463/m.26417 type:complete len:432 (+) Transcript_17463:2242-3537(+)
MPNALLLIITVLRIFKGWLKESLLEITRRTKVEQYHGTYSRSGPRIIHCKLIIIIFIPISAVTATVTAIRIHSLIEVQLLQYLQETLVSTTWSELIGDLVGSEGIGEDTGGTEGIGIGIAEDEDGTAITVSVGIALTIGDDLVVSKIPFIPLEQHCIMILSMYVFLLVLVLVLDDCDSILALLCEGALALVVTFAVILDVFPSFLSSERSSFLLASFTPSVIFVPTAPLFATGTAILFISSSSSSSISSSSTSKTSPPNSSSNPSSVLLLFLFCLLLFFAPPNTPISNPPPSNSFFFSNIFFLNSFCTSISLTACSSFSFSSTAIISSIFSITPTANKSAAFLNPTLEIKSSGLTPSIPVSGHEKAFFVNPSRMHTSQAVRPSPSHGMSMAFLTSWAQIPHCKCSGMDMAVTLRAYSSVFTELPLVAVPLA